MNETHASQTNFHSNIFERENAEADRVLPAMYDAIIGNTFQAAHAECC